MYPLYNCENRNMTFSPLLSIIVPCYNAEKYIDQCVNSILASEFQDFELLLIDDGSKSGCEYLKIYEKTDHRVKVFSQQNRGVSAARNLGLEYSSGEWVTFIDADDFISPSFLDELICLTYIWPSADIIHAGCTNYWSQGNQSIEQQYMPSDKLPSKSEIFKRCRGLVPSKLFRKEIIKNNAILFDERMKIGEDLVFTLEYLKYIRSGVFSPAVGYYYRRHPQSTTAKPRINYAQKLYEYKRTSQAVFDAAYALSIPSSDLTIRSRQLGKQLIDTIFDLYRSNSSQREERSIEHIKNDFKSTDFDIIEPSSFSFPKRIFAYLLKSKHFTAFDILSHILFKQK